MTTSTTKAKWTDESVAKLVSIVGNESPVSVATLEAAATAIGTSVRSVAAKLRNLEILVSSTAVAKVPAFTAEEGASLADFVANNAGKLTYAEIAEKFAGGKFSPKQVQGKILALELTGSVKAAEKVEIARTYSDAEEAQFISMVAKGAFIEEIAAALNKTVQSVRGKALSLTRQEKISKIPAQKESHAKESVDAIEALGTGISAMTVGEIAAATDKTVRGIKTALTRRGISVKDYDGAGKKAKAEDAKAKAA